MSKWHYFSVIILSLILIIVIWKSPAHLLIDDFVETSPTVKHHPDAYLINTTTTQYNEQGNLSHILKAVRIDYFTAQDTPEKGYNVMAKPDIQFYDNGDLPAPTWHISASKGHSDLKGDEIQLTHDVILSQENIDGQITQIFAEDLLIKANEQYAITHKPVMIKSPSGITTADGLEVSLNTEIVKLLTNVKTRYKKP